MRKLIGIQRNHAVVARPIARREHLDIPRRDIKLAAASAGCCRRLNHARKIEPADGIEHGVARVKRQGRR
jgi:hypothetical protein